MKKNYPSYPLRSYLISKGVAPEAAGICVGVWYAEKARRPTIEEADDLSQVGKKYWPKEDTEVRNG